MRDASNRPLVSIGLPVYNGQDFIADAIESLLNQSIDNYEIVISDNASTDGTEEICRKYSLRDKRIRYVRQGVNIGIYANFKFVLDYATGDYFMWASDDDRWNPEFIKEAVAIFESNPEIGLVSSWSKVLNHTSGETTNYESGYSLSRKKLYRFLHRAQEGYAPFIIFGLQRIHMARKINIKQMDYYDVYLAYWYELNSKIVVIPRYYFIKGVRAEYQPYSVEGGGRIGGASFLSSCKTLLKKHFSAPISLCLYVIIKVLIIKNIRMHNKMIYRKMNDSHDRYGHY